MTNLLVDTLLLNERVVEMYSIVRRGLGNMPTNQYHEFISHLIPVVEAVELGGTTTWITCDHCNPGAGEAREVVYDISRKASRVS